jgi:Lrp/AsnC family leucine-responsive transcriptional regulator
VSREHRTDFGDEPVPAMDAVDRRLLALLQDDAKLSLAALGEAVDLAPSSVAERVKRLEGARVIRGYHAVLDPQRVGLDLAAFIGVSLNYPKHIDAFERVALAMPEVQECHHVTGAHSLLLKVRARNTAAMERVLSKLRGIDGVMRTETMVVFSTRIERARLPTETTDERPAARPPAAPTKPEGRGPTPRSTKARKGTERG